MRPGLFAAALALFLSPALAPAADPAVVYQTQPLGRLLDDLRTTIQQVGGNEAVKSFNDEMKRSLGDKGFDGFDLNRPIVGFIDVPADLTDTVAVVAFPVTGEKEWLDFVQRWNKAKPKALKDGVYEVPGPGPNFKAAMRVSEGYAYVATGMKDPARVLGPKAVVPFGKMYDPTDVSLMAGRVYFDRLPKEVRAKAKDGLEQLKKMTAPGGGRVGVPEKLILDPLIGLASRWLELSEGAKEAVLRVNADTLSGEMVAELTVTPIPGSRLEKVVGGIKPTTNRFAALVTPDSVGGLKVRLPLEIPEVKDGLVKSLEAVQKEAANNAFPPMKGVIDELLKGLIRTAKTGEMDAAAALRGPDKNGTFTGVGAVAFDDPSAFEKEIKKFVTGTAPQQIQDGFKWDAEKVNGVSIHVFDTSKLPNGGDREMQALFGQNMTIAFAFAPKAVYLAVGPGEAAVKAIKEAMALKPVEAPTVEFAFNADRVVKLVGTVNPQGSAMAQKVVGKTDKLVPAWAASAAGGKELKLRYVQNVKLFAALFWTRGAAATAPVAPPLAK